MNTKGIKFLAVLAVMVMAFAAIVVLAPADKDVTAIEVYGNDDVTVNPTVIDGSTKQFYYISDDATVKIKDLSKVVIKDSNYPITFLVQNGKELELDFKESGNVKKEIAIYTVTSDQQRTTTSTVEVGGQDGTVDGKILLEETAFTFTGEDKQDIVYKAAMPSTVITHTTSGGAFATYVDNEYCYATISASVLLPAGASTGELVAVADGQYIESKTALGELTCGVAVVKKDGNDLTNTYYATGMNAGTFSLESSDESVIAFNGSVIVSVGNASAKVSCGAISFVAITYGDEDQIAIGGYMSSGSMNVSGNVAFNCEDNMLAIDEYATVTLNGSANVLEDSDSGIIVGGKLVLKNDADKIANLSVYGDGFIIAENEKLWSYPAGTKPTLTFYNSNEDDFFTGQFDVTAISKKADVEDSFSTAKIEKNQTFRMVGDTIVAEEFIIEGTLYIEPGVTLTITQTNNYGASITVLGQYAQIINNGTIVVKTTTPYEYEDEDTDDTIVTPIGLHVIDGCVLNYNVINASSLKGAAGNDTLVVDFGADLPAEYDADTFKRGGFGFVNYGTISIGKYDTALLDENFTNSDEGTVNVGNGTLKADSFVNDGTFSISNGVIKPLSNSENTFTVTMETGAVFQLSSADVAQGTKIIIENSFFDDEYEIKSNRVSIEVPKAGEKQDTDTVRVSGLTVTDTSIPYVTSQLDISGSIGVNIPKSITDADEDAKATLATEGNIDVTATLTINKGYELDFSSTDLASAWTVYGTATISKDVKLATGNTNLLMVVYGKVTDVDGILSKVTDGFSYIGAKYTLTNGTTDIYTNLNDAIPAAVEANVDQIYVGSDKDAKLFVVVTENLLVPKGISVDGEFLMIDEQATIAVESGARFSFGTIIVKDGMLTAEDVNNIDFEGVIADVMKEDTESTAAVCMSLEVALKLATPGAVIELANSFFAADETIVIPEGVTVDATAADDETKFTLVNSNLVVNGKLVVNEFAFVATTDDKIGITVNGYIYDKHADGKCFVNWWYNPFGVSYNWTDEEDNTWFVLTTIANIQPAINEADDAKVTVQGNAKLDELTVSGRDDMPAEVTFKGTVNIGVINIDDTTLKFTNGKKITATVKDAIGSITIVGAYAADNLSIYSLDDQGVYMAGTVTDSKTGTYSIRFDGITGMNGNTKANIDWSKNTEGKTPTVLFAGETTVIGKKAKIGTGEEKSGMATITGLLYTDHACKLEMNCDVEVIGKLAAAEKTEENPAVGTIATNGNLFIGMYASDIYDMERYPYYNLADAATISGNVTLTEGYFIYVAPGSSVAKGIISDLDTMGIYVDNELWFNLYGYEDDDFTLEGLAVPMSNARIAAILDGNMEEIEDCWYYDEYPFNVLKMKAGAEKTLSEYGNVYIGLNYDIFEVKIKTDGSVKAVYIDGILMETGESKNIFIMKNVAAGTYKVTVEAATGYDADKCVLYTEMGTILPNMGFTFTELDCTEYDREADASVVVYNISGTEIQPEPVPPTPEEESQWTVTTILLVILVVLIAIMAVIVALRLNRS